MAAKSFVIYNSIHMYTSRYIDFKLIVCKCVTYTYVFMYAMNFMLNKINCIRPPLSLNIQLNGFHLKLDKCQKLKTFHYRPVRTLVLF